MGDRERDAIRLQRSNHKSHTIPAWSASARTVCEERRALRSEYFKKKSKGHSKAPAYRRLDG